MNIVVDHGFDLEAASRQFIGQCVRALRGQGERTRVLVLETTRGNRIDEAIIVAVQFPVLA